MSGRFMRLVAAVLATAGVALLCSATIAAADGGSEPIVDVGEYPAALPDGCPQGADGLFGLRFDNGRGASETELSQLGLDAGDTLTMNWDGFAAGCLDPSGQPAVLVSLAAYLTPAPTFDPAVDQRLVGWSSCGAGAGSCGADGSGYQLNLALPGPTVGCRFQPAQE